MTLHDDNPYEPPNVTEEPRRLAAIENATGFRRIRAIALITPVLFLFSLSLYFRTTMEWDWSSFDVVVERSVIGYPPWLTVNEVKHSEGSPPELDSRLPDGELYRPGWHIQPLRLIMSLFCCSLTAAAIVYTWAYCAMPTFSLAAGITMGLATLAGVTGSAISPSVGLVFGASMLLLMIAEFERQRSYVFALVFSVTTITALWAAVRAGDHFRTPHLIRDLANADERFAACLFVPMVVPLSLVATLVARGVGRGQSGRKQGLTK